MTTDQSEDRLQDSAARLVDFLRLRAPRSMVQTEMRLAVQLIGGLVGPERVREWLRELTDRTAAALTAPAGGRPCRRCKSLGRLFGVDGEPQCPECRGLGLA